MKRLLFSLLFPLLTSCAIGTRTPVGDLIQQPTSVNNVQVYHFQPSEHYVYLGMVSSHSRIAFSPAHHFEVAEHQLKVQASKLGANGVIIYYPSSSDDSYEPHPIKTKTLYGKAILVEK